MSRRRSLLGTPWALLAVVGIGLLLTAAPGGVRLFGFVAVVVVLAPFVFTAGFSRRCPNCGETALQVVRSLSLHGGATDLRCEVCGVRWRRSLLLGLAEVDGNGDGDRDAMPGNDSERSESPPPGPVLESEDDLQSTHGQLLRRKQAREQHREPPRSGRSY